MAYLRLRRPSSIYERAYVFPSILLSFILFHVASVPTCGWRLPLEINNRQQRGKIKIKIETATWRQIWRVRREQVLSNWNSSCTTFLDGTTFFFRGTVVWRRERKKIKNLENNRKVKLNWVHGDEPRTNEKNGVSIDSEGTFVVHALPAYILEKCFAFLLLFSSPAARINPRFLGSWPDSTSSRSPSSFSFDLEVFECECFAACAERLWGSSQRKRRFRSPSVRRK